MLIIVSVSDWDGHRILGVFSSEKKALEHVVKAGFKIENDNLYFDIVKKNRVSKCQEIICSPDVTGQRPTSLTRKHLYEQEN